MKCTSITLGMLASIATACVVDDSNPTCPTKTISNIVTKFEDRNTGVQLTQYHHLNYNNLTVQHQGDGPRHRGVIPHSPPNYGLGTPDLSLEGTKTTSFDFTSAWVGCIAATGTASGHKAIACKIAIDCVSTLSFEGHFGPQLFDYAPSGPDGAAMMFVEPAFTYCQEAPFTVWDSAEPALIVVDNLLYTIREGECLPTESGGTNPSC